MNVRRLPLPIVSIVAMVASQSVLLGAEPIRVLFIGNSYTYFNNGPAIFSQLAASQTGRKVETEMVAAPGETLISLWQRSKAREILTSSKWDYVVLQCQSQLGDGLRDGKFVVNAPALLHWGVRLFDGEIKRRGARTVLFLTWSRKAEPEQQADLNHAYDSVAREIGAILAPVGPTWQKARMQNPEIELYAKDGSHPSPLGSYLAASVIAQTLFRDRNRKPPAEIVGRKIASSGKFEDEAPAVLVAASPEETSLLHGLARDTVRELRDHGGYLNAAMPSQPLTMDPRRTLRDGESIDGRWAGTLSYFPSSADLEIDLALNDGKCEGAARIKIPDRKQSYGAPLAGCTVDGNEVVFSVVMLPVPFLLDRFTGHLRGDTLAGTVERTGRELTNRMTGSWSLRRTGN